MEIPLPGTIIPTSAEERRCLRRREVRASLQARIRDAQMTIDEGMAPELERLQYEHEIARRLMARAADEKERQDWEIETSVLHDMASLQAGDLEEQQVLIARYEAMIAEIDTEEAGEAAAGSPHSFQPTSSPANSCTARTISGHAGMAGLSTSWSASTST